MGLWTLMPEPRPKSAAWRASMRKTWERKREEVTRRNWWVEEDWGHDSPCWIWQRSVNPKGYGMVSVTDHGSKRTYRAHRYVYELHREPIPSGMTLDHLCRVRACVNPDHLEVVTQGENVRRGLAFREEHGIGRYEPIPEHLQPRCRR